MNRFYGYFCFLIVSCFISACNNSKQELDTLRNKVNSLTDSLEKNTDKSRHANDSNTNGWHRNNSNANGAPDLFSALFGSSSSNTTNLSSSNSNEFKLYKPGEFKRTSSTEIVGLTKEEEDSLKKIISFISNPGIKGVKGFKKFNAATPRGLLLYGPPGTGKTEFARIIVEKVHNSRKDESREVFVIVASGAEFQDKYVGEAAKKVKRLFEFARNLVKQEKQVIIFIDEFDALAAKRNDEDHKNEQMVNQLLTELDGFDSELNSNIFIIAATNLVENIDKAVIRPGRIDIKIEVGLPDDKARESLIKLFLNEEPKIVNIDVNELVRLTKDWSIAEIKGLVNEARGDAAVEDKDKVEMSDFHNAIPKINPGSRVPDENGRYELLKKIFNEKSIHAVNIDKLTKKTKGWTAAEIKDLVNKAILRALGKRRTAVMKDFDAVIKMINMARP